MSARDKMIRLVLCDSADHERIDRLVAAINHLGGIADDPEQGLEPATGFNRYRFPARGTEISIFRDAWMIDLAGPEEFVEQILELMRRD